VNDIEQSSPANPSLALGVALSSATAYFIENLKIAKRENSANARSSGDEVANIQIQFFLGQHTSIPRKHRDVTR